jgi:hypothetical protein
MTILETHQDTPITQKKPNIFRLHIAHKVWEFICRQKGDESVVPRIAKQRREALLSNFDEKGWIETADEDNLAAKQAGEPHSR